MTDNTGQNMNMGNNVSVLNLLNNLSNGSGDNPGAKVLQDFIRILDEMLTLLSFPAESPDRDTVKDRLSQALLIDFTVDFFKHIDAKALENELKDFGLQQGVQPSPEKAKEVFKVFQKYMDKYKENKGSDLWQDFRLLGAKVLADFINNMGDSLPADLQERLFQMVDEYNQG